MLVCTTTARGVSVTETKTTASAQAGGLSTLPVGFYPKKRGAPVVFDARHQVATSKSDETSHAKCMTRQSFKYGVN